MAINGLNIGVSALQANQRALDISANNVANALTAGFQPSRAVFQATAPSGVVVNVSQAGQQLAQQIAQQTNGSQGNTSLASEPSGTDLATEIVNQIQYKAGFNFAANIIKTNDEILGTLLDLRA